MATESRLAPVPGPVPHSYPVKKELQLPEAFTSTATHFTPIILTNEEQSEEESHNLGAVTEGPLDEFTKSSEHIEEWGLDSQTEPRLHTQELPINQTVKTTTSTESSDNFPSVLPDISCLEVSLPQTLTSSLNGCGIFNNYLFIHDPTTGHLSLVPVQVRAPESLLGLDVNLSLIPQSLQRLITVPESTGSLCINCLDVRPEAQEYDPLSSHFSGNSVISVSHLEHNVPRVYNGQTNPGTRGENQSLSESVPPKVLPALQEVIGLLKGEFSLDGYLKNGHEDIAMGEYIFSLKDLQYPMFASVVKERFSDLYWEDDVLDILHGLVNYSPSTLIDQSPSEAEFLSGREEGLMGAHDKQMSPDYSEEMEDSDSLVSERLLLSGSRTEGPDLIFSPAWALAFFGEDCFSPEVIQYAGNLGQHAGLPCLGELQQQLIIETRNLKKMRNFYQKLIQQERKNKGSESKVMLSKLKTQLEELRSRVIFLDSVKKYLEILSVDQWGLELSLLHALAVCGPDSLDLQSYEDTSFLSFGTSKGKSTLHAGSPLGLMAYLYARNAAVEGYIQHFLYTFRFFCTPEHLLRFIMDKFISAARECPNMSGNNEKVFHRSLDLLHIWITDCKGVDFTPKSCLLATLENFLNTKVIPVDSRGEALLTALHRPLSATWSQRRVSLISIEEDDESMCLHSSTEDLGKKWRISRVVEPSASVSKDKAFSIASALPAPCYSSRLDDLSTVFLHSEERLPFSQNENSAQHVAQQLTLLQQEMFQGCHPVNFLNSREQGVRDKVFTTNKNVSQHSIAPAEGSSLFVCEGPPSDSSLQQLLTYADSVTNWISAEIVTCDSVKTQVVLLTKYLWIGKHCYESRNFATAMQVLGALENVIVRQLPAWKHLSSKVCEILEELRAVQVFLKSDDLCLMGGEHLRRRPTLPSVHILAMHIQQREIGAFTLTTGAYKWTKLRSIAKVVSQVHAFQEAVYTYSPDWELQAYLRRRIARLATSDIHLLAADNDANFQQPSERQTRRIQNTLRKVKATFQ
uniref:Kinase non-catalytic C-lobe domain containing 1 n=1 Tax=Mastacembelus armatus TaxID=205130 RepID=A0A7N9AN34_9TELE